jgi:uncharacterized protein (DUF58 family)
MHTSYRTAITRAGLYFLTVAALVFSGAMLRQVNLLLFLAGMLLGPLLIGWRLAVRTLAGLRVRRGLPPTLAAGETLAVTLALANPRRRLGCWTVAVEDCLEREAAGPRERKHQPRVVFPYVRAGDEQKIVYRLPLSRRGRYRFGPLRVSTAFPFGLVRRRMTVEQPQTLTVLPRLGRLRPGWQQRRRPALAGGERRRRRQGAEGEVFGLRTWRRGDSRRTIHWRTTARTGQLVVRQLEQPQSRDLAIVLDLWQPDEPRPEQLACVELAVSFAATVAADLCRRGGGSLYLAVGGDGPALRGGPASVGLLHDLLQRLAVAEAQPADRAAELLAAALAEVEPGTELVLVSTRPADLADAARFAALDAAGRRAWRDQVLCVDASSAEVEKFFEMEG